MHKPESVRENETHQILWYFEIQTDPLITVRRPDKEIIIKNKENLPTTNQKTKKTKKETNT